MCGRFFIPEDEGPKELLALLNHAERLARVRRPDFQLKRGEIRPGDEAVVIAPNRRREASLFIMRWGFRLDRRLIFNARAETADERPLFRDSLRQRRCVVPAAAFFEWDHRLTQSARYRFWSESLPVVYLAGLYRPEEGQAAFTVLTREAEGVIADMHPRMPVLLTPEQVGPWLDEHTDPAPLMSGPPPSLACRPG